MTDIAQEWLTLGMFYSIVFYSTAGRVTSGSGADDGKAFLKHKKHAEIEAILAFSYTETSTLVLIIRHPSRKLGYEGRIVTRGDACGDQR